MNQKTLLIALALLLLVGLGWYSFGRKTDKEPGPQPTRDPAPRNSQPQSDGEKALSGKTKWGIGTIKKKSGDLLGSLSETAQTGAMIRQTIAGITNREFNGPTIENHRAKKFTRSL